MNSYPVHYYLRGELLGSKPCPLFNKGGLLSIPMPLAFICPRCGDGWAKRDVPGGGTFRITLMPCEKCGGGFLFPRYCEDIYLANAPRAVLERELLLIAEQLPDLDSYRNLTGGLI